MASAKELGQAAQDQAAAVWKDTKESAGAKLAEHKDNAAEGLGQFAQSLRKAARDGADQQGVGRIADFTADGLERVSASLRGKDLEGLLQEAESFARRQPVAFFGAALAAGFLAVRFAKASRRDSSAERPPASSGASGAGVDSSVNSPVISGGA